MYETATFKPLLKCIILNNMAFLVLVFQATDKMYQEYQFRD